MCLLIFSWQPDTHFPLVVAANRDEWLDRPADAFGTLVTAGPRVLGGRDLKAGGTWLAVNDGGVVAGLTNRPTAGGRDDSKRSRGELPLLAAGYTDAASGIEALVDAVGPGQFNPAAMLVGDRDHLFAVELAPDRPLAVTRLTPGLHVLENAPYGHPSAKVDLVTSRLGDSADLWRDGPAVLADHTITASTEPGGDGTGETPGPTSADGTVVRPAGASACCVHLDGYGTRSSALIRVPAARDQPIDIRAADGAPCDTPFQELTGLWNREPGRRPPAGQRG